MTGLRGLELARRFHVDAVQPILARRFPDLEHAAALIGTGSEVLGFDDEMSTDHHWGPRVQLFVDEPGRASAVDAVSDNTDMLTRPHLWRVLAALYDRTETREESEDHGV